MLHFNLFTVVIDQEKGNQAYGAILQGIESFDPAKLKPTETQEKNPLPTKEGLNLFNFYYLAQILNISLYIFQLYK